jgi:hypothetical protein
MTANGLDIDFSFDAVVSGEREWRQSVLLRLQHDVTFTDLDYGLDLQNEIGKTDRAASLGLRACAAIQNDPRFTATATNIERRVVDGAEEITLSIDVSVDDSGETFSLEALVANGQVSLAP